MKIGFLTHGTNTSSSTRIRAMYVAKYIQDSVISNEIKLLNLSSLDAIVFQKRFKKKDVDFAIKLKDKGVQIALDLVDPVWDKDYPACYFDATNDKKEYFDQMVELSDCIVFSTPELEKMFLEYYTGNVTLVIPDGIDLGAHPTLKFHLP
jgi:sugar/nucleoside kinase (ribokinase family)